VVDEEELVHEDGEQQAMVQQHWPGGPINSLLLYILTYIVCFSSYMIWSDNQLIIRC
jgi:hypothetical protein